MLLTWLGQSGIKIVTGQTKIYIDPVDPHNAHEPADIIIVTHDHPDHFNLQTIQRIIHDGTRILGTAAVARELHGAQILHEGETVAIGPISIAATPAYTVRRDGHVRGEAIGAVLRIEDKNVYHLGDTDVIPEMRGIKADIVLVPISGVVTMNVTQAVEAVNMLKPKIAIPVHYGSRGGTADDAELFKEYVEAKHETRVIVIKEGETIEL